MLPDYRKSAEHLAQHGHNMSNIILPSVTRSMITGVVLAGGQGTRMGGKDKGLISIAGHSLVEHLCAALAPQTATLIINANRNCEHYQRLGYPVVSDANDDYSGPLAGLLATLHSCTTQYLVSVPCDAPLLPRNYVLRMFTHLQQQQACVAMVDDQIQPVHVLLKRSSIDSLEKFIAQGGRKVGDWVRSLNPAIADFSDCPECFWNMNTPEELQHIKDHLQDQND